MPKTSWKLSGHIDTVTITFQAGRLFDVELDANEIDDLLRNLGDLRAMMRPAHSFDFTKDENSGFMVDPRWEYEYEPLLDQRVLRIRDPRFGWLRYVISDDFRAKARRSPYQSGGQTDALVQLQLIAVRRRDVWYLTCASVQAATQESLLRGLVPGKG